MVKQLSPHAAAAKEIRKELKKEFPNVKFSVRSESFAGGDSVAICFEDGPTVEKVCAITDKYQEGSFNSMEDIYELTNRRDDISQVKYVTTYRSMSSEAEEKLTEHFPTYSGEHEVFYSDRIRREFGDQAF